MNVYLRTLERRDRYFQPYRVHRLDTRRSPLRYKAFCGKVVTPSRGWRQTWEDVDCQACLKRGA